MKTDHREACRRRHRIVADWLALYTWKLGADCIVPDRDDLGALLSVWRRKESRIHPVEKLGDDLYLSPEVVQWLEAKGCFNAFYVDELCAYIKKEKDNERPAARRGRMVGKAVSAAS
jgi:hypothetical protein